MTRFLVGTNYVYQFQVHFLIPAAARPVKLGILSCDLSIIVSLSLLTSSSESSTVFFIKLLNILLFSIADFVASINPKSYCFVNISFSKTPTLHLSFTNLHHHHANPAVLFTFQTPPFPIPIILILILKTLAPPQLPTPNLKPWAAPTPATPTPPTHPLPSHQSPTDLRPRSGSGNCFGILR